VRVRAAAVNPADTLLRSGGLAHVFAGVPGPYVPGMDIAGVIDEIGPDTETGLSPGDPVMAMVLPIGPAARLRLAKPRWPSSRNLSLRNLVSPPCVPAGRNTWKI
jgi:NADPH:quinone reductase-like Zn-dependent oxidoreductase